MNIASLTMALLPGWLVFTLLYAILVKLVERRLKFTQSLLLSVAATATWIALIVVYQLVKALLPQNVGFDAFAMLFVCCAVGTVVTWLARKYDIAKRGWLGLGAKANLWLGLVCLVLLPGRILAISYFR
jgi:hypothetical protein